MKRLGERLILCIRYLSKFSNKVCLVVALVALLPYFSNRSYLIAPPSKMYGPVLYRPGDPLETGVILPGKLTSREVELVEEILEIIEEPVVEPDLNIIVGTRSAIELYEEALAVNSDVIGYIYIPNCGISYPVLHKPDKNNYYLKYDINNKKSVSAAIYLDDHCGSFDDQIKLIHGHSMRGGGMFGILLNYKTQSWADARPYIYLYDGSTTRVYEMFSCTVVNATNETVPLGFNNLSDKLDYFNEVRERSKVISKDISDLNDILILNTCSYEGNNFRTLVYASRVTAEYNNENMVEMGEV